MTSPPAPSPVAPSPVGPSPASPSPLVAPREDTTRATSGVALVETADALHDAIASGSWQDGTLAGLGVVIELAAAALDPLGALAAAGIGWLIEHVRPLSELLDRLTGDPDAVAAQARTWRNVAAATRAAGDDLARATAPAPGWEGSAADASARTGAEHAEEVRAAARVADALGSAVDGAGRLVSLVREVVRELIAQLIATLLVRIPQWTLEEVGTLGLATPHVVASALAVVAKVGKQVVGLVRTLVGSLRHLGGIVDQVTDLARRLFPATARATPTGPAPPRPTGPASPRPTGPAPASTAPAATPIPDAPFGPGAARAEGLSPRALLDDPATLPAARPPDDPVPAGPRPGSGPPSPEELAQISRIREALEPTPPTRPTAFGAGLPPVAPGTRTLVDALPEARVTRGLDGLIARIDGRPYREVVEELGRRRADELRAARDGGDLSASRTGNVSTVAFDRRTGVLVEATNEGKRRVLPDAAQHPAIREGHRRLEAGGPYPAFERDGARATDGDGHPTFRRHPHPDAPLRHAEVKAVNELLQHRGPDAGPRDLGEFAVTNHFPFERSGVKPAPCCANCTLMLGGVESLTGKLSTFPG